MNIRQQSDNNHQCKMPLKMKMNTNKKQLYSWKTQNKQLRVNLEANCLTLTLLHSSCDDPSTAEDSSVSSHSVLTTPLAAMDCCSSVTHAPKRLGFFRLNNSLFSLADLKEFFHHGLLLQLFPSSPFHCKNAWQSWMVSANDDTMEPS